MMEPRAPTILVADDGADLRRVLGGLLETQGFEVITAEDGRAALERVREDAPSLILLDLVMPGLGGLEALAEIRAIDPEIPVIILTAHGTVPTAVQAMQLGACDYLTKPFQNDDLLLRVRRALERQALRAEVEALRSQRRTESPLRGLMGPSRQIQKVIQQVEQVAGSPFTVLIQGETGTGKELVARAIHRESARREEPFIALDCGAIPETLIESELFGYERGAFTGADRKKAGHFQLAEGGSLFLDEIANLPPTTQATLLRALEERQVRPLGGTHTVPVNARILAAANRPLEAEMQAGRFRQDLYYRLSEFTITLPPLRERQEDILYLAQRFLEEASLELRRPVRGIAEAAAQRLLGYAWPGNARELRNVIREAVLLSRDVILPVHLRVLSATQSGAAPVIAPAPDKVERSLRDARREGAALAEQRAIRQALQAAGGNKSQAARLLQTDYKTLHLKMKRYGIPTQEFLPRGGDGTAV